MPDIFKNVYPYLSSGAVRIPDVGGTAVFLEREPCKDEPETEDSDSSGPQTEKPDDAPQPEGEGDADEARDNPEESFVETVFRPSSPAAAPPPPPELSEEEKQRLRQEIIDAARAEAEELKKQAYDNAYSAAYSEAVSSKRDEIAASLGEVKISLDGMKSLQAEYFEKYSKKLAEFACEIAGKILAEKIESDELVLEPLVMSVIDRMKSDSWLNVEVSAKLIKLADALKKDLADSGLENVEITPAAGEDGLVRVMNETGTIDASISTQIDNLRRVFDAG